ncbi:hypothetical protein PIB30_038002 [Stylosanthes scabra]|uniref:No apical meristem-associated C-terminal domain-containing protein n=1 Tax=Stylosanthes scabra TaxID=79078 RepID=A0ABU6QDZ4_9FABA|nr:hypothetical protein [Stylosanthes scabra]
MKRGVGATKKRWHNINKAVAQFAGCYDQATQIHFRETLEYPSFGTKKEKPTTNAKRMIQKNQGHFGWSILIVINPETPLAKDADIDSPVRPQGSKKSKRREKGKAQMSEDLSEKKLSIVKKLALIEDFVNFREKEMSDLEKEREMQKEHKKKLMAMKEKELQMKEQELQIKEREMDMQIFNANTYVMSERRRALHEIAFEKIIAK